MQRNIRRLGLRCHRVSEQIRYAGPNMQEQCMAVPGIAAAPHWVSLAYLCAGSSPPLDTHQTRSGLSEYAYVTHHLRSASVTCDVLRQKHPYPLLTGLVGQSGESPVPTNSDMDFTPSVCFGRKATRKYLGSQL